jgi:hypothetical protein
MNFPAMRRMERWHTALVFHLKRHDALLVLLLELRNVPSVTLTEVGLRNRMLLTLHHQSLLLRADIREELGVVLSQRATALTELGYRGLIFVAKRRRIDGMHTSHVLHVLLEHGDLRCSATDDVSYSTMAMVRRGFRDRVLKGSDVSREAVNNVHYCWHELGWAAITMRHTIFKDIGDVHTGSVHLSAQFTVATPTLAGIKPDTPTVPMHLAIRQQSVGIAQLPLGLT